MFIYRFCFSVAAIHRASGRERVTFTSGEYPSGLAIDYVRPIQNLIQVKNSHKDFYSMLFVFPKKQYTVLFPPLFFHIHKSNRGISVPSPIFGLLPVLDCLGRAEMDTGTAEFTVVLPERFFIHHFDIFYRDRLPHRSRMTCMFHRQRSSCRHHG